MNLPFFAPLFRSIKFTGLALITLFLLANLTGIFISHAFAPLVKAETGFGAIPSDVPSSGNSNLDQLILSEGEAQGIDPRFIHAVIWHESKYDPKARSHAGAEGLMQLMPATAKRFGCDDINDPVKNVKAGTKYLGWLLKRFNGNVQLALAGYNAGEGSVDKYSGIPPFSQTQNYVRIITARYGRTFHPVLSPEDAVRFFNPTE